MSKFEKQIFKDKNVYKAFTYIQTYPIYVIFSKHISPYGKIL